MLLRRRRVVQKCLLKRIVCNHLGLLIRAETEPGGVPARSENPAVTRGIRSIAANSFGLQAEGLVVPRRGSMGLNESPSSLATWMSLSNVRS